MIESKEVRRLTSKWSTGTGWPKRLEWIQIDKVRGWGNERFELRYPIMAIVGENRVGKSTILQAIASLYKTRTVKLQARKQGSPESQLCSLTISLTLFGTRLPERFGTQSVRV